MMEVTVQCQDGVGCEAKSPNVGALVSITCPYGPHEKSETRKGLTHDRTVFSPGL